MTLLLRTGLLRTGFALLALPFTCFAAPVGLRATPPSPNVATSASHLVDLIIHNLFNLPDRSNPTSSATASFLDIAPKLTSQQFQKVLNAGGGEVEPGTEGFDPYTATMEPNDKCRTEANKYRTQCLFGNAFNDEKSPQKTPDYPWRL